jgi:hypothetical protein
MKAVDTLHALRPFEGELDPSSPVVSRRNGIGDEAAIETALGGAVSVILCITTESSSTIAPELRDRSCAELLASSVLRTTVVYDIRPRLGGKRSPTHRLTRYWLCSIAKTARTRAIRNVAQVAQALASEEVRKNRVVICERMGLRQGSDCVRCRYEVRWPSISSPGIRAKSIVSTVRLLLSVVASTRRRP